MTATCTGPVHKTTDQDCACGRITEVRPYVPPLAGAPGTAGDRYRVHVLGQPTTDEETQR